MSDYKKEIKKLKKMLKGRGITEIDLSRLEEHWAEQGTIHTILCKIASLRRKVHSEAKAHLDVVEAEAELKIRRNPNKYGVNGDLKEALVKAQVTRHPDVLEAQKQMIEAKYQLDLAESLVNGSEHQKKGLENEVSLWSQSYFAKPKTSRTLHEKAKRSLEAASDRKAFRK